MRLPFIVYDILCGCATSLKPALLQSILPSPINQAFLQSVHVHAFFLDNTTEVLTTNTYKLCLSAPHFSSFLSAILTWSTQGHWPTQSTLPAHLQWPSGTQARLSLALTSTAGTQCTWFNERVCPSFQSIPSHLMSTVH